MAGLIYTPSIRLRGLSAQILVLIFLLGVCRLSFPGEKCWLAKGPLFPAGSKEEVMTKAAAFLIKAEAVPAHPYWPKGKSGVTLGVGWDAGYHSEAELRETWAPLGAETISQLANATGKRGREAQTLIPALRSIEIPRSLSIRIFTDSLKDHYYPFVVHVFPGLERLPADIQVVFISVVFNRGAGMGSDPDWGIATQVDQRWEIRRMREDVKRADVFAIYAHLGTMKRLWQGADHRGLLIRRRDEQALIRPYVNKQLQWEADREKLKQAGLPPCPNYLTHSQE